MCGRDWSRYRDRRTAIGENGAQGRHEPDGGGGIGGAGDAEARDEQERGQQRARDGAEGIGGIEPAAFPADNGGRRRQGAHQDRQRAAHQKGGNTDQCKDHCPSEEACLLLDRSEPGRRRRHQISCDDTQYRDAGFEAGIEKEGARGPVDHRPERQAAQRQPGEEGADPRRDREDVDADDER